MAHRSRPKEQPSSRRSPNAPRVGCVAQLADADVEVFGGEMCEFGLHRTSREIWVGVVYAFVSESETVVRPRLVVVLGLATAEPCVHSDGDGGRARPTAIV